MILIVVKEMTNEGGIESSERFSNQRDECK